MDLARSELPTPDDATLQSLEALAVDVAREAGRLIVDERPPNLGVSKTKSTETDVVTIMDQRAQDLLRTRLQEARPRDGFLGEEEGGTDGRSEITWVVDPIDGTVNYLYGIPSYSVSVAAVVGDPRTPGGWQPVAGAVVNPVTGELFRARAGAGAHLEGGRTATRRLVLAEPPLLGHALVGTGFGYDTVRRQWQASVLLDVLPEIRDIRRMGSAALDICSVAAGSLDAYFERGLNPWDMAAAWLVLVESGGVFSGLEGQPPSDRMVVAAAPTLHTALHDVVLRASGRAGIDASL